MFDHVFPKAPSSGYSSLHTTLAWQHLTHTKVRTVASTAGITFVILLIFVQLGLYAAVVQTGSVIYDHLNFDLMLLSPQHVFINWAGTFPRHRLYQASTVNGVAHTMPLYIALPLWQNPQSRVRYRIQMLGFHLTQPVFQLPELSQHVEVLYQPDTVLTNRLSRPEFGPLTPGTVAELQQRTIRIVGQYTLDLGLGATGSLITSDQNFSRVMQGYPLERVSLGLILLTPGAALHEVASRLRSTLPADVHVMTRAELKAREKHYWVATTSTGIIFGTGTIVAFLVGIVALSQMLASDVTNHFAEYATLKALGYTEIGISLVVLQQAGILAVLGFVPALALSLGVYELIRTTAHLAVSMTLERLVLVFILVVVMGAVASLIALRKVHKTDPAELF